MKVESRTAERTVDRFWTAPFVFVCLAQFLGYANNTVLWASLPLYLTSLGHTPTFVGVVISVWSVTSFVVRPWVGELVDRRSARGVNVLGGLTLGIGSFGYLLPGTTLLLASRVISGYGWAAINTAGPVIGGDATPPHRRGEAMGYLTVMASISATTMPALSIWLMGVSGFPSVFVLSGLFGLGAAAAAVFAPVRSRRRGAAPTTRSWSSMIVGQAVFPSILLLVVTSAQPITTFYMALYAQARGIEGLSLFFVGTGIAAIIARSMGGLSDRWGRAPVVAIGLAVFTVSLLVMMWSSSLLPLVLGGALNSVGFAMVYPTLMALALDVAPPGRRGAAMATYTAAFQIGVACGGLWGVVIELAGYTTMFLGAAALSLAGLLVLLLRWKTLAGASPSASPPGRGRPKAG